MVAASAISVKANSRLVQKASLALKMLHTAGPEAEQDHPWASQQATETVAGVLRTTSTVVLMDPADAPVIEDRIKPQTAADRPSHHSKRRAVPRS